VILALLGNALLPASDSSATDDISVEINCSAILDRPAGVKRISMANGDIAEAVPTSPTEIVINGKTAGDTTLIVWDQSGNRSVLGVHVLPPSAKLDLVRDQILREAGQQVTLTTQDGLFFLNGTARDLTSAERAFEIASSLGKVVNLLRVTTPAGEPQILLKVRFADIDRSYSNQFALNLAGLNNSKGVAGSSTGQFGGQPSVSGLGTSTVSATFSSLLNVFYFRPDLNVGAFLEDLETRNILQTLAEPNLLTVSGKQASFLSGGEFPFPTLQGGGSGVGQITIQFRDFGIKLNFTPTITPRGTIRLRVNPEVSSLDYSNGLTVGGITVPGLTSRRVDTEVELKDGQSFVIAGLLNNSITEQLSRMPGLSSIPLFGKLFNSRSVVKNNTELVILITPVLVNPTPAGQKTPDVAMDRPFMQGTAAASPQQPSDPAHAEKEAETWRRESLPVEDLKAAQAAAAKDSGPTISAAPSVSSAEAAVSPAGATSPATSATPSNSTPSNPSHPNN
jgi:pilus assembly protein CpaC